MQREAPEGCAMDNRRFDQLTRLIGQGASRRTILKGLLGLGGATIAGAKWRAMSMPG
ncbi:MAG: hypothetical protein R2839_09270 [Thermomicrobiales bacterium]